MCSTVGALPPKTKIVFGLRPRPKIPLSVFPFLFLLSFLIPKYYFKKLKTKNKLTDIFYIYRYIFSFLSLDKDLYQTTGKSKKTRQTEEDGHLSQILKQNLQVFS